MRRRSRGMSTSAFLQRAELDHVGSTGWQDQLERRRGMTSTEWESARAWQELTAGLVDLAETFLAGDRKSADEAGVVGGFKTLATLLGVGFDTYLFPDRSRPIFFETVVPNRRDRRWGGDNTDAYYYLAPLDPARTYRIWGTSQRQCIPVAYRL